MKGTVRTFVEEKAFIRRLSPWKCEIAQGFVQGEKLRLE
jgi:hypothetical protein